MSESKQPQETAELSERPVQGVVSCGVMIRQYLAQNGYDGLYNDGECGCELADLFPCGGPLEDCEPGYKTACTCGNGCDFDIRATKSS